MHHRPNRQHETRVLARISSQTFGDAVAHKVESRPRLLQRRRLAYPLKKYFIGVLVGKGETRSAPGKPRAAYECS